MNTSYCFKLVDEFIFKLICLFLKTGRCDVYLVSSANDDRTTRVTALGMAEINKG